MSVRLQYIIPGWEPAPVASGAPGSEVSGLAPWKYGAAAPPIPPSWKELLGLDRAQPGEFALEPPPTPASISYADTDEDRKLWNGLLARHLNAEPASPGEARLLGALAIMHQQDQEVTARLLMEGNQ